MKTIHFISGLPRSGSTLLANILSQNPRFYTTSTSGILDVLFSVRNNWDNLIEFKATPNEEGKLRVLRGILESYFDVPNPVVFDKSRGWTAYMELAEYIIGGKVKVIVPVRDMRDVLASFEKLWRRNSKSRQLAIERERYFDFQSIESRTEIWLEKEQAIGLAYRRIKDAISRGYGDRLFFLKFEELTKDPEAAMTKIYEFLGEEPFVHDFNNVIQVNKEDDNVFGFESLHTTRPKVEPMEPQWLKILGPWADKYKSLNFW